MARPAFRRRVRDLKERKNFFPTLIITIICWLLIIFLIVFVDPAHTAAIFLFFVLIFPGIFLPCALVLANTRRGLLIALVTLVFLIFRYLGIGSLLNLVLLILIAIFIEVYIKQSTRA